MEHTKLAPTVRLLRPRAQSNLAESQNGPSCCPASRRRVRPLSRNAPRETSHATFRLQPGFPFARIPRRRKTFRRFRSRPPHPRSPCPLTSSDPSSFFSPHVNVVHLPHGSPPA